jgi:hypothetical protein
VGLLVIPILNYVLDGSLMVPGCHSPETIITMSLLLRNLLLSQTLLMFLRHLVRDTKLDMLTSSGFTPYLSVNLKMMPGSELAL